MKENPIKSMVGAAGLEPATLCLEGREWGHAALTSIIVNQSKTAAYTPNATRCQNGSRRRFGDGVGTKSGTKLQRSSASGGYWREVMRPAIPEVKQ